MYATRWSFPAVLSLITSLSFSVQARASGSDVLLQLKPSFLKSIALLAPSTQLGGGFGKLFVHSAWSCSSPKEVQFLAILSDEDKPDVNLLNDADCEKTLPELISSKTGNSLQVATRLLATNNPSGGISLKVAQTASWPSTRLSVEELNAVKSASIDYNSFQVPLKVNDAAEVITVVPKVNGGSILLHATHPQLRHPLGDDINDATADDGNNATIEIATETIQWATKRFLANQAIKIRGTPFVLRSPSYETAQDQLTLQGIIEDTALRLSVSATAIWRGADLKLDDVQARSSRACGDFICKAKKATEDAAAQALSTTILSKYKGTSLSPDTKSNPVSFELGERKYDLKLEGRSFSSATADYLAIHGNIYVEVAP